MLSRTDREERARSIRRHLLNYMTRMARGAAVSGKPHELLAAKKELDIFVRLESDTEEQEVT